MTTHSDEIIAGLKAKKDECLIAGCMDDYVKDADCIKRHNELKGCMRGIQTTVQTKNHFLWELGKVVLIPVLTTAFVFGILQTKVDTLTYNVNKLERLVIELIQDRR